MQGLRQLFFFPPRLSLDAHSLMCARRGEGGVRTPVAPVIHRSRVCVGGGGRRAGEETRSHRSPSRERSLLQFADETSGISCNSGREPLKMPSAGKRAALSPRPRRGPAHVAQREPFLPGICVRGRRAREENLRSPSDFRRNYKVMVVVVGGGSGAHRSCLVRVHNYSRGSTPSGTRGERDSRRIISQRR